MCCCFLTYRKERSQIVQMFGFILLRVMPNTRKRDGERTPDRDRHMHLIPATSADAGLARVVDLNRHHFPLWSAIGQHPPVGGFALKCRIPGDLATEVAIRTAGSAATPKSLKMRG